MTSIVQLNGQKTEQLGTRLSCFGREYKMAEYFTRFMRKIWTNYWLKTEQEQEEKREEEVNLIKLLCFFFIFLGG